MKRFALVAAAVALLPLMGCATAQRIAIAFAPTGSVAANASVANHCVGAQQAGTPVDLRRQNRLDFAGIAYDMEVRPLTTAAQQKGVEDGRDLRRRRCPIIPEANAAPADPLLAPVPEEPPAD